MSFDQQLQKFGRFEFLPEGWFWLLRSKDVARESAQPAHLLERQFVVYRGHDNQIRVLDAHCPHMGAHLCDGKVEGNDIRCPFHFWKFNEHGRCVDIPCQSDLKNISSLNVYRVQEAYGLIWLWTGACDDQVSDSGETVPVIPELKGKLVDYKHGNRFVKNCHPNVMMINAIDAQHFRSVHNLFVELEMKPTVLSSRCIQLSNTTPMPQTKWWLKLASRFYKTALTYEMTYWWGHNGSVMVGPDFLHFYIMFALRPTLDGKTEGHTLLLTPKRRFGFLLNPVLLFLTKLVGNYFAKGDTIIFSRINFKFKTPIRADRAILHFVEHYEQQKPANFGAKGVAPCPTMQSRETLTSLNNQITNTSH